MECKKCKAQLEPGVTVCPECGTDNTPDAPKGIYLTPGKLVALIAVVVVLAAAATFGFCDQFSNFIKDLVGRLRPLNDEFMLANGLNVLEKGTRSFSFFSAHSANAFGLATSTCIGLRLDKKWFPSTGKPEVWGKAYTGWMFFWAAMVAISRAFVGKHYIGDIIVGTMVGFIAGYTFIKLALFIIHRFKID